MLDISATRLVRFASTWVGNKNRYEGVTIPKQTLVPLHAIAEEMLLTAFLKPFEKTEEFFYLHHEEDVTLNAAYQRCSAIFQDPENMNEEVARLAQQLYKYTDVPKIQGGEFFVAYFEDLLLHGEPVNAIGLWKVQSKDPFLKTERTAESFALNIIEGIPTDKPEVAALIFNLDEAEGFRVCMLDKVTKKGERSFWKDEFLRLRPMEDNYFQTRHYISVVADFIGTKGASKLGLNAASLASLMNAASDYFKDNEEFEIEDFSVSLFADHASDFQEHVVNYGTTYAVPMDSAFEISRQAVKKEGRIFKSVIKLDKNFQLHISSGRPDLIERGFDDATGRKFYKVFFDNEE